MSYEIQVDSKQQKSDVSGGDPPTSPVFATCCQVKIILNFSLGVGIGLWLGTRLGLGLGLGLIFRVTSAIAYFIYRYSLNSATNGKLRGCNHI